MSRTGAVPPILRRALRPATPHCYRHCDRPLRGRTVPISAPGWLCVYACPGGAVSVVTYHEWAKTDPTPTLLRFARSHTSPSTVVRRWDMRLAGRHGPELGVTAERFLAKARPIRPVRVVYWRLYPFKKKDGSAFRLFACFRHGVGAVQFFVAPRESQSPPCPRC
ncbi:MAG: hypothetical protein L3K02_01395 [Thermoplasmata archaeon]|nr:hypothetical protein [Thermoplasmata archaeon]